MPKHETGAGLEYRHASVALHAGVARCDLTPPVGIYARMWGAAAHDVAEGVHRSITATVLAFRATSGDAPLLLVSLDWVFVPGAEELEVLRTPLLELVGGDVARVIIACTHTHSTGLMSLDRSELAGGELIPPYLELASQRIGAAAAHAVRQCRTRRCTLAWATGRCALASNRDMPLPGEARELTGFNPTADADDTLLVGRLTDDADGRVAAMIVNYACHPTTLAWENRLLSPDYVGAMREVVESATGRAPCAFLQGASGELAPKHQYVADTRVADAHGATLGHAVLGVLASMLPPRQRLAFAREVPSGAPLAVWALRHDEPDETVMARLVDVPLPLKSLPPMEELERELARCDDRVQAERLRRRLAQMRKLGTGPISHMPAWCWRLGDALWVAHPNEAYSDLQRQLRLAFPDHAVIVMNVANGSGSYLYPASRADRDSYTVDCSLFGGEALNVLIAHTRDALRALAHDGDGRRH